jgi:hypothetical protein
VAACKGSRTASSSTTTSAKTTEADTTESETADSETSESKDAEADTAESKSTETESAGDGHRGIGQCVSEVASAKGEAERSAHGGNAGVSVHGQQGKGHSDAAGGGSGRPGH